MPLATAAGLAGLESRWRRDTMDRQTFGVDEQWIKLESRRGLYNPLGRALEEYAAKHTGQQPAEATALLQSAQAFIAAGDMESQMRVMRQALARNVLSGVLLDRNLALLAAHQPDELLAVVRGNASADVRNRAVQFAIAGDRNPLAYAAVLGRGAALPPVWARAYTALAGQYFDEHAPAIDAAFRRRSIRTIGDRLKTPLKPDSVIVGSVWFSTCGGRYGEYLAAGKSIAAGEWLPASLEAAREIPMHMWPWVIGTPKRASLPKR
jgi:hypothetical protein